MYVMVDLDAFLGDSVSLEDPENFETFEVVVGGQGHSPELDRALDNSGTGFLDAEGCAMVRVDALRQMAAGKVGPSWETGLASMLRYAGTRGWLSEDGEAIRAHIEWK